MIEVEQAAEAIASPHVHAVTLTGPEAAGRELSRLGMLEFVNAKTVWIR